MARLLVVGNGERTAEIPGSSQLKILNSLTNNHTTMIRLFVNLILLCVMAFPAYAQTSNAAAKRKQALQGVYTADVSSMGPGVDARDYGKYVIKGDNISFYRWNQRRKTWDLEHTAPFRLVYYKNNYYMTGYNIVFRNQYGDEEKICTGDTNRDGKMDLWQSDSMFYTKQ